MLTIVRVNYIFIQPAPGLVIHAADAGSIPSRNALLLQIYSYTTALW